MRYTAPDPLRASFFNVRGFGAIAGFGDIVGDNVTLLDGSVVPAANIQFDESTYHEILADSGVDITYNMKQADKVALFPNFDKGIDDDRVYRETTIARGYKDPGPQLPTGLAFVLGKTITSSLGDIAKVATPTALIGDVKDLILFAVIGAAIYFGIASK